MSKSIFDAEAVGALLVPTVSVTSSTTFTGLRVNPKHWPTCAWVLDVSAVNSTGTYTFTLQVSDVLGGTYTTIAGYAWPAGVTTPQQVTLGVNGQMASFSAATVLYARVNLTIAGGTPSITVTSWITKSGGHIGSAVRPGNIFAAV